ncbi:hypothetical protein DFS34DRAFT_644930 [Phlyctochytrium arcticum]|nr:hypothetical protein DFS34DRAFT_644930 [Phlyctochytrium arcticum]
MVEDLEVLTRILREIFTIVRQTNHLPNAEATLRGGVENCARASERLEATTLFAAGLFQRSGLGGQERLLVMIAEFISVMHEFFRSLAQLVIASKSVYKLEANSAGELFTAEIPQKDRRSSKSRRIISWNNERDLHSNKKLAVAAVYDDKASNVNRCTKVLVRTINRTLDFVLSLEQSLFAQCAFDSPPGPEMGIRRLRDAIRKRLHDDAIYEDILLGGDLGVSKKERSKMRQQSKKASSGSDSDGSRSDGEKDEGNTLSQKDGPYDSIQTLCEEEQPIESERETEKPAPKRRTFLPGKLASLTKTKFGLAKVVKPSRLREEIGAEEDEQEPTLAGGDGAPPSVLPSPYEALVRHIEEIENAQLEMLQHSMRTPMPTSEYNDSYVPNAAQNTVPRTANFPSSPISLEPQGRPVPQAGFHPGAYVATAPHSSSRASFAHTQSNVRLAPSTMTHPYVMQPKIALTEMKKEWEPSLAVTRQLLRQDSGSTSWKVLVVKLSPVSHSLLVFSSGKYSTKDVDFPVRDPELSGLTPVHCFNLRNAVIERASNVPRRAAIRVRLVNGVSVLIDFHSDFKADEWVFAMRYVAGSLPYNPSMSRKQSTAIDSLSRMHPSGYVSYPSATSFVL